jgi:hypothetical protein
LSPTLKPPGNRERGVVSLRRRSQKGCYSDSALLLITNGEHAHRIVEKNRRTDDNILTLA